MAEHKQYHKRWRGHEIFAWLTNIGFIVGMLFVIRYFIIAFKTRLNNGYDDNYFTMLFLFLLIAGLIALYLSGLYLMFVSKKRKDAFFKTKVNEPRIIISILGSARVSPDGRLTAAIPLFDTVEPEPVRMGDFSIVVSDEISFDSEPPVKVDEAQFVAHVGSTADEILRYRNYDASEVKKMLEREGKAELNTVLRYAVAEFGRTGLFISQPVLSEWFAYQLSINRGIKAYGMRTKKATMPDINENQQIIDALIRRAEAMTAFDVAKAIDEAGIEHQVFETAAAMTDKQSSIHIDIKRIQTPEELREAANRAAVADAVFDNDGNLIVGQGGRSSKVKKSPQQGGGGGQQQKQPGN